MIESLAKVTYQNKLAKVTKVTINEPNWVQGLEVIVNNSKDFNVCFTFLDCYINLVYCKHKYIQQVWKIEFVETLAKVKWANNSNLKCLQNFNTITNCNLLLSYVTHLPIIIYYC